MLIFPNVHNKTWLLAPIYLHPRPLKHTQQSTCKLITPALRMSKHKFKLAHKHREIINIINQNSLWLLTPANRPSSADIAVKWSNYLTFSLYLSTFKSLLVFMFLSLLVFVSSTLNLFFVVVQSCCKRCDIFLLHVAVQRCSSHSVFAQV